MKFTIRQMKTKLVNLGDVAPTQNSIYEEALVTNNDQSFLPFITMNPVRIKIDNGII